MEDAPLKLDENGIPVLEHPVNLDALEDRPGAGGPDLADQDTVEQLLDNAQVRELLDSLTDDLEKLVSGNVEAVLQEELARLAQRVSEESRTRLLEDIRAQLQLSLPALVAKLAREEAGR